MSDKRIVNSGSEVHIYTSETFPDCPDYSGYAYRLNNNNNTSSQTNGPAELTKEIEVAFTKPLTENFLSVIPNPSSGKFLVQLNSSDANSFIQNLCIYDILGKQVYSLKENIKTANIDLSSFSKGIYYLKANDIAKSYYKKIIIK